MKTEIYLTETLKMLLLERKIATLPDLKTALGTDVERTIFRKLTMLGYHTSYSHGGRYYTLKEIAQFDEQGLWSYAGVHFSHYGKLTATAKEFVTNSEAGYSSRELSSILKVKTKDALLYLCQHDEVWRKNVTTVYIYFAADTECRRKQLLLRYAAATMSATADENEKSLRTATMLFFSQLDEQQRRLYAGLEALKLGHGGNQTVAEQLGLDAHTVAKGKQELLERTYVTAGARRSGGGRVAIKKTAGYLP
jgi:hypothetical protein